MHIPKRWKLRWSHECFIVLKPGNQGLFTVEASIHSINIQGLSCISFVAGSTLDRRFDNDCGAKVKKIKKRRLGRF